MRFERLFQPITILNMEVKNRFAMTSISNLFATIDGYVKFEIVRDERKQISVYPEKVTA